MESPSHEIEDLDETPNRPNITPQDEIVSSYLEKRSAIFRDLVKLQSDVWNDPQAAAYFKGLRKKVDNPRKEDQLAFFLLMVKIGDEIDAASGGGLSLQNSHAQVLDLGMAPGGFTRSVQKRNQHAYVCAFTLPPELGGHEIIHYEDPRVNRMFGDITMLHQELRITDLPKDHPEFSKLDDSLLWSGKTFDLIFCDGQALRTHQPYIAEHRRQVEATRLTVSQLILAMQRIKSGGTLIVTLHKFGTYDTIKIVSIFDRAAKIQVFKPVSAHTKNGTFYLIAKEVQPGHPEVVAALKEWKRIWKALTFPVIDETKNEDTKEPFNEPGLAEEVLGLLDRFADRVIELGEPIWQIQKEALATPPKDTVVAEQDSEEDGNDAEDL
ncbi:hypothetical protein BDR22DRAFT_825810 [Usnea florida]